MAPDGGGEALCPLNEYCILDADFRRGSAKMSPDFDVIRSGVRGGRFRYLGYGAGRRVYDMGNGYVVKVARNSFGFRQNRSEYRLSQLHQGDLLAKVVGVSDGYQLLVMQAAMPLRDMQPVLDYFHVVTKGDLATVPELVGLVKKHHTLMKEFLVARNWGLINNRPVIIDYGFVRRRRGWPF